MRVPPKPPITTAVVMVSGMCSFLPTGLIIAALLTSLHDETFALNGHVCHLSMATQFSVLMPICVVISTTLVFLFWRQVQRWMPFLIFRSGEAIERLVKQRLWPALKSLVDLTRR